MPYRFNDKSSVFYNILYLCLCIITCYFTGIFYAVVRQISMFFIDNNDSVFCSNMILLLKKPHKSNVFVV